MSQKDRKKVMDHFEELNAVHAVQQPDPNATKKNEQQNKMSLSEAVSMFGAQIDGIKNNLIGIIMKQDSEIKRLMEELGKKKV